MARVFDRAERSQPLFAGAPDFHGGNGDYITQNSNSNDRPKNNNRNSNDRILSHPENPHQHSQRIVEVLRLKLKESAKRRERAAERRSQVWCVSNECTVPEPSVLLEPEDVSTPDADDLVIEILTDQVIDFDESSTDVLEIFAETGEDKKRVEFNERKMTDEDRKLLRRAEEAELQSWLDHKVFDVVNEKGCRQ